MLSVLTQIYSVDLQLPLIAEFFCARIPSIFTMHLAIASLVPSS